MVSYVGVRSLFDDGVIKSTGARDCLQGFLKNHLNFEELLFFRNQLQPMENDMTFIKQAVYALVLLGCVLQSADFAASRIMLDPLLRAACAAGVVIDERDRRDVVVDLRKSNLNWYPAVPANTYLEHRITDHESNRLVPLGGVANAQVVGCNDSGYYSTFATDAFGFNNPEDAWENSPKKKIFFLGDSFVQGDCRRPGETIIDQVRARVPGVINLGSGGNGPLLELAAIREYIQNGAVDKVFWVYFEGNDVEDIKRDQKNEVLVKYLTPDFSQRLRERKDEVNAIVRQYVEKLISDYVDNRAVVFSNLRKFIWNLRHEKTIWPKISASVAASEPIGLEGFENALSLAKTEVEAKGGRFFFVYLPEYSRFSGDPLSGSAIYKEKVMALVKRLGINIIDVEALIKKVSNPLTLYPFGLKAHFNPEGTLLVAQEIEKVIRAE
jgi:hypothetical protein